MSASGLRESRGGRRKALGLDWFEWSCFGLLAGLSFFFLVYLLGSGRVWTGGEGPVAIDQLQYLTWIREAGNHGLIGNRWDFAPDHRVFLHPGFLLSGLVHRATGLPLPWSYTLLWKPVALIALFASVLVWVRTLVSGVWPRRVALFICLFVVMPWSGFLKLFGIGNRIQAYVWGLHLDFPSGEIWTVQPLHGYSMTVIAIALMISVLLGVYKAGPKPTWQRVGSLFVGVLLVMWLQPWQGAELLFVIAGAELWLRLRHRVPIRWRLAPLFFAGLVPALYYAWIAGSDASWKLAGEANSASAQALLAWPWWAILATFVPLALPAALAYRIPTEDWGQLAARLWPLAAVAVYLLPVGTFPFHAMQGVMIPLGVLIVQGLTVGRPAWLPAPRVWVVIGLLAFFSIPGTVHKLWSGFHQIDTDAFPYTFGDGEEAALKWLANSPLKGGVLTDEYGGALVPPYAGREAFVGPFSWTPELLKRSYIANVLFKGPIRGPVARLLVAETGARFIFQPCHGRLTPDPSLRPLLGDSLEREMLFGCARVYVLKPTPWSDAVSRAIGGPAHGS